MDEYTRLYKLYLKKSNSELQEIINPKNGYTEDAIKAASDVLSFRGIKNEQIIEERKEEILSQTDNAKTTSQENKKAPAWILVTAVICCVIAGFVLFSGVLDLSKGNSVQTTENNIMGNFYNGSGTYFGLIFYFPDENTYMYSTSSGEKIAYGTYELNGNALKLYLSSESYAAVVLNNGDTIKINDSELTKATSNDLITYYKSIFVNGGLN